MASGTTDGTIRVQCFPDFVWTWDNGNAQFYTASGYGAIGSPLGSPASFGLGTGTTVELRWTGGNLEAWRNGSLVHSATTSAPGGGGTETLLQYFSNPSASLSVDFSNLVTEDYTVAVARPGVPLVRAL